MPHASTNTTDPCFTGNTWSPAKTVIVGTGLIGGSLARALRAGGYTGGIVGICPQDQVAISRTIGAFDSVFALESLQTEVAKAGLVVLAVPIGAIVRTLDTLALCTLPSELVITDTGSVKSVICEHAARVLPTGVHFAGGHPMCGSEKSGPTAADPALFQNAAYALTTENASAPVITSLAQFFSTYLGCRIITLTPREHDRIAAAVSHLPHLLAVALVNAAAQLQQQDTQLLSLAAGGFRDMTRIAESPYSLWKDILIANQPVLAHCLKVFRQELDQLEQSAARGDAGPQFQQAAQVRTNLPLQNKGFLAPLAEIIVSANDEPGCLARLTTILARAAINIKDIELLKVREGLGGTLRLGFDSPKTAHTAARLLSSQGFAAHAGETIDD